jgi:gamma-glutamyl phosphate reductase
MNLQQIGQQAKDASYELAITDTTTKNAALEAIALELEANVEDIVAANKKDIEALKNYVAETFHKNELLELEYFEIVNAETLQPIAVISPEISITACIAVHAGNVRLIDNIQIIS